MRTHANTLYVTTQGAYLARDGSALAVRIEKKTALHVPIHNLAAVVCFGQVACSPPAMGLCAEHGVSLSFLSHSGRFLARVEGPVSGNVLLRRRQYRLADDPDATAQLARAFVAAKVANARVALLRGGRSRAGPAEPAIPRAADDLAEVLRRLRDPLPLPDIRGLEGEAGKAYVAAFDELIVAQKESFYFRSRSRRPPMDNVNALLSFLYALLAGDCRTACESVGLDPQVGFLHADRPGRPSLALDLMEELRPVFADRLALTLINRRQVDDKGFTLTESGGVEMSDETRKTVVTAWQKRKDEEITHPYLGEKVSLGLVPLLQARLLARAIRGELDVYPAFFWR